MKNRWIMGSVIALGLFYNSLYALDFKEGNWEIAIDTEITALNMKLPTIKRDQCLTQENAIPKQEMQDNPECTAPKPKISGSTVTWSFSCPDGSGNGTVTYKGKTFTSTVTVVSASGEMKMDIKGRYKGSCK